MTTDIHQRDQQIRTAYTRVFKGFVRAVETSDSEGLSSSATQMTVLMIGGLAIARALNDVTLSDQVLSACQEGVDKLREGV